MNSCLDPCPHEILTKSVSVAGMPFTHLFECMLGARTKSLNRFRLGCGILKQSERMTVLTIPNERDPDRTIEVMLSYPGWQVSELNPRIPTFGLFNIIREL